MVTRKNYCTVRCVECRRAITTIAASAGISSATCELCMRTAEGRPLPKMTDYQSNTDFTLGIARLLGDEQMLQDHAESVKVATLIPESLVQRVFNLVSPRRRHIKTDVVGESLPGMSAEQIARGRKRDPMF